MSSGGKKINLGRLDPPKQPRERWRSQRWVRSLANTYMWQSLVQTQSNPHVLLIGLIKEPSPGGWEQALANWASAGLRKLVQNRWWEPRTGGAGLAAAALGSREGTEVRAWGVVAMANQCWFPGLCERDWVTGSCWGCFWEMLSTCGWVILLYFIWCHWGTWIQNLGIPWVEVSIRHRSFLCCWSLSPPQLPSC